MSDISEKLINEIAEHIIIAHTEDIEFMSTWEITEDRIRNEDVALSMKEIEEVVRRVDKKINTATVTVTFED